MSYCRFSSDDWKSDVYVYGDVNGGYTIHVAGLKRVGFIPPLPDISKVSIDEFYAAYKAQMEALNKTEMVRIGLQYDGETFNEPTLQSAADRLKDLKKLGYHVPKGVIEELEAEIMEKEIKQ